MTAVLVALLRFYQIALSPLGRPRCRFFPTCSEYAIQSLQRHGAGLGMWRSARRLARCHPFGGCGYDPVE